LFKLRVALFLAGIAGLLTFISGLMNDTRPITALYRTGISLVVFGCGGFFLGGLAQILLVRVTETVEHKGQNIDIADTSDSNEQLSTELAQSDDGFRPLTSDMVKRVYRSS